MRYLQLHRQQCWSTPARYCIFQIHLRGGVLYFKNQ